MKQLVVTVFVVSYLGALGYGLFAHAVSYRHDVHPAMYFLVWDMYCGWSAYETRQHVVGEGASGTYYRLTPPPWGSASVYGPQERQTHDYPGTFVIDMARNSLRHSSHEPIVRLMLVEEAWPRKYNLPAHLWAKRHNEPRDPVSYFQIRRTTTAEGQLLQDRPTWLTRIAQDCLMDNPRLRRDVSSGRQFYAVSPDRVPGPIVPTNFELPVK
jgi:hypothetical protein